MVASLDTQKVQLTTLAIVFLLHIPTYLLFYNLLPFKYYFSFFFYYIFLPTLDQRENKHIYKIIHKNKKQIHTKNIYHTKRKYMTQKNHHRFQTIAICRNAIHQINKKFNKMKISKKKKKTKTYN
jgi:hypothetical protein